MCLKRFLLIIVIFLCCASLSDAQHIIPEPTLPKKQQSIPNPKPQPVYVPEPTPQPDPAPVPDSTPPLSTYIKGYEAVDLGLPSGVKWATCNVGATLPEQCGNYYAWGETSTKASYTKENSDTYGYELGNITGWVVLDVARSEWGATWRIPTQAEMQELVDNCKWNWTTIDGQKGYKVTGPNSNSIFMPAAGYRDETSLIGAGQVGYYWTSTPYESMLGDCAYNLIFGSGPRKVRYYSRYRGRSVRPVSD